MDKYEATAASHSNWSAIAPWDWGLPFWLKKLWRYIVNTAATWQKPYKIKLDSVLLYIQIMSGNKELGKSVNPLNLEGSLFKWGNENRPMLDGDDNVTKCVHPVEYKYGVPYLKWNKWKWTKWRHQTFNSFFVVVKQKNITLGDGAGISRCFTLHMLRGQRENLSGSFNS